MARHTDSTSETAAPLIPTMRDRMVAGQPYVVDGTVRVALARGQERADLFNETTGEDPETRRALLRDLLGSLGEGVEVRGPVHVDVGRNLHLGARTFVNANLVALDRAPIRVGEGVQIGPNVQLLTPVHPLDPAKRRDGWEGAEPVTIGDNVVLGGGVTVCPGVTIGDDTVVGAGSVVASDLPAGVLAVGNPAKVIRQL
ncbi:sugar O-acetyltransferase [Nocardioides jishulii]|nr:sugar O-acetyltransferase [Nocardioides jishulii]